MDDGDLGHAWSTLARTRWPPNDLRRPVALDHVARGGALSDADLDVAASRLEHD